MNTETHEHVGLTLRAGRILMNRMSRVNSTLINVGIIISIVILIGFMYFVSNVNDIFNTYYNYQLKNYSNVFRKTIDLSGDYTEVYEQSMADDLHYRLNALQLQMQDVPLKSISRKLLKDYCQEYGLFAIAIIAKDNDGMYVHNSTFPDEVGERTDDWGYWNDAFKSLFLGQIPKVEGYYFKDFWLGPRSKSYYADGFYRYAYYFNEDHDYIINGIVQDDNSDSGAIKNMLDQFFEHLESEITYIDKITLIDLESYEKTYNNDFRNPESPTILYGTFKLDLLKESGLTPDDLYSIKEDQSFTFDYEGSKTTIFMSPAEDAGSKYLISILLDDKDREIFVNQITTIFLVLLVFTLGVLYLGLFIIVSKYRNLLTFEKERNEEIETFTRNIALLPENIYKCRQKGGELMLTYNYGKDIIKEKEISLESSYRSLRDFYSDEYVEEFKELVKEVFDGKSKRFQISYDGNHYEHFVSPIFDEDNKILEIIGIATNINDRRIEEEQAKYQATHDYLTDLINRRDFEDKVKLKISENPYLNYALMILDLDDFKDINDNYGHLAGDSVLKQVANRLKKVAEESSDSILVARMGGDEFAVFQIYESREDIIGTAKKIIESSLEDYEIGESRVNSGISIGISLYSKDLANYKQMFYYADMAMYQAKKTKGNTFEFYSEGMELNKNGGILKG
jgi:diguanylate cyclase (GGDEF)-like protein